MGTERIRRGTVKFALSSIKHQKKQVQLKGQLHTRPFFVGMFNITKKLNHLKRYVAYIQHIRVLKCLIPISIPESQLPISKMIECSFATSQLKHTEHSTQGKTEFMPMPYTMKTISLKIAQ